LCQDLEAQFGRFYASFYIDEVFAALTSAGIRPSAPAINKILLTAHSGGGEVISTMMAEPGQPRMPANLKMVALFDAINGDKTEFPNVEKWVIEELELDLKALQEFQRATDTKCLKAWEAEGHLTFSASRQVGFHFGVRYRKNFL